MASSEVATVPTASKPEAKITLHWLEKSRSQRILWLFEELKVPYELKTYKRGSDMLAGPDLKAVHPLGKSPVISVQVPGKPPLVIAESAAIVEYIVDYYAPHWIPKRYSAGQEAKIACETEEWLRYRQFMHYAEGSLMTLLIVTLVVNNIRDAPVPFFIKPITRTIAGRIDGAFLTRNHKTHFEYVESMLKSSPSASGSTTPGDFICGSSLTGADVMMSYPLEAAIAGRIHGLTKEKFPFIYAYVERIQGREAYKKANEVIKDKTGKNNSVM